MRILVASDREYRKTSRGIDIITTYLAEKGHFVDHLVFFRREQIPEKQISKNIRQLYFFDFLKIYRFKMRSFLPGFLIYFYFSYIIKKQKTIDFSVYDWIITETSHSIYLSLVLNNKIILRISDPPEIAFVSDRRFYKKLELCAIKKSYFVSSAIPKCFYPLEYNNKIVYWHSGYIPLFCDKNKAIKKKIILMGSGNLDIFLIKKVVAFYPDYIFHVIGSFKKKIIKNNIIFHGYLKYDKYQEIFLDADVCFIPLSKYFTKKLRRYSYTAKILLSMSLGMPILLRNYGTIQDTDPDKKLFVYKTHKEALALFDEIIHENESGKLTRDVSKSTQDFLFSQTMENQLRELDKIFSKWIK